MKDQDCHVIIPCCKPCIYYCLVLRCSSCKVLQISARFALSYKSLRRTCFMTTNLLRFHWHLVHCFLGTRQYSMYFSHPDKISQYRSPRPGKSSIHSFVLLSSPAWHLFPQFWYQVFAQSVFQPVFHFVSGLASFFFILER